MGKRSDFERAPRDFYPTPMEAVLPLIPHLPPKVRYAEPCAGDGALIRHLGEFGMRCEFAGDIEPQADWITKRAAGNWSGHPNVDMIITNPPWDRKILHSMIDRFSYGHPTWLLFDADWVHTKQAAPFMPSLRKIVAVGRVKWIPDSKFTGKDNCAWHLFGWQGDDNRPATEFYGRQHASDCNTIIQEAD